MHVQTGMFLLAILTTVLTTGPGSVLFGMAYVKTRQLALPIGLQVGWNFAQALVPRASGGNIAKTLLIVTGDKQHYNFVKTDQIISVKIDRAISIFISNLNGFWHRIFYY